MTLIQEAIERLWKAQETHELTHFDVALYLYVLQGLCKNITYETSIRGLSQKLQCSINTVQPSLKRVSQANLLNVEATKHGTKITLGGNQ